MKRQVLQCQPSYPAQQVAQPDYKLMLALHCHKPGVDRVPRALVLLLWQNGMPFLLMSGLSVS